MASRIIQIAICGDSSDSHGQLIVLRDDGTLWRNFITKADSPWDRLDLPPGTMTRNDQERSADCLKCQQPTFYAQHSPGCPNNVL